MNNYAAHLVELRCSVNAGIVGNGLDIDEYIACNYPLAFAVAVIEGDDIGKVVVAEELTIHLQKSLGRAEDVGHIAQRVTLLLGTPSMVSEFVKAGFEPTTDDPDDVPDAMVVAFDMTLDYSRLCRAAWWAQQGIPYVATNPDRVCPTDQKVVLVDCGSICKCIEHATGRQPDITLGKPDPNMLTGIRQRYGLEASEIAMVGDRIYTDVQMAFNAGAMGVLVLSGETTLEIADEAPRQPDIIADNIGTLGNLLEWAKK